jgi:hypothetical protein
MTQAPAATAPARHPATGEPGRAARLRALALEALPAMFRADEAVFAFRVRRSGGLAPEGRSPRYTAMALIGLAREDDAAVHEILRGASAAAVCERLLTRLDQLTSLGDVAVACWAANELECTRRTLALRQLAARQPDTTRCSTVELAWALSALCSTTDPEAERLRRRVAARLMGLHRESSRCFPHQADTRPGLRSHVACFADQIYPVLALAQYAAASNDDRALGIALAAARHLCALQGPSGQWWWHYDTRQPQLVERYPVYAVHQDAMAPMALHALERVSGVDFTAAVERGLAWLVSAPELGGASLVDPASRLIWRKVCRREPAKASRYLQAVATRLRPGATWPQLDRLLPPGAIDYECRPYHLGWLLYAWRRQEPA